MQIRHTMNVNPTVDLVHQENFQFRATFGGALPELLVDEPEPIGSGMGPSPEQLLVGAVASCLASSLFFALRKFDNDATPLKVHGEAAIGRNEHGRLRVQEISVEIALSKPVADHIRLQRALWQFEDFCTVSQSVRQGLPVHVVIRDSDGKVLK